MNRIPQRGRFETTPLCPPHKAWVDISLGYYMSDDHLPFLRCGVSMLHIIVELFLVAWHTLSVGILCMLLHYVTDAVSGRAAVADAAAWAFGFKSPCSHFKGLVGIAQKGLSPTLPGESRDGQGCCSDWQRGAWGRNNPKRGIM